MAKAGRKRKEGVPRRADGKPHDSLYIKAVPEAAVRRYMMAEGSTYVAIWLGEQVRLFGKQGQALADALQDFSALLNRARRADPDLPKCKSPSLYFSQKGHWESRPDDPAAATLNELHRAFMIYKNGRHLFDLLCLAVEPPGESAPFGLVMTSANKIDLTTALQIVTQFMRRKRRERRD